MIRYDYENNEYETSTLTTNNHKIILRIGKRITRKEQK